MNSKQQGDIGVAQAIAYYTKNGYICSFPLTDNSKYDLIVDKNNKLERVQVKTSGSLSKYGVYQVQLRTLGGNSSWSGVVTRISSEYVDKVFIYSLSGKMYEFPSTLLEGRNTINLGEKYSEYEL